MKHLLKLLAIAVLAVAATSTAHAQDNPLVGTWKLNVAKSKFDPGPQEPDPHGRSPRRWRKIHFRRRSR